MAALGTLCARATPHQGPGECQAKSSDVFSGRFRLASLVGLTLEAESRDALAPTLSLWQRWTTAAGISRKEIGEDAFALRRSGARADGRRDGEAGDVADGGGARFRSHEEGDRREFAAAEIAERESAGGGADRRNHGGKADFGADSALSPPQLDARGCAGEAMPEWN